MPQHEFAKAKWIDLSEKEFSLITASGKVVGKLTYLSRKRGIITLKVEYDKSLEFSDQREKP